MSVFNAQEAREAVLGGARIVDSEDPRSALGNIKPRQIMTISDAVLNYHRDLDVQLSTNIGEDQLLFKRSATGRAIEKSQYEIAGKAAQAAIGVACAMGTRVHPCNIIKVGLDGMSGESLAEVLREVVLTINRTEQYLHSQIMSVLFVQDLDLWEERRSNNHVRSELVALREFHSQDDGPGVFDLCDFAVGTLLGADGRPLFPHRNQVNLESLIAKGVLPDGTPHTRVALNNPYPHADFGLAEPGQRRTSKAVIKRMIDLTAEAGADSIMLDTSILLKVARVSLLKTSGDPRLVDVNRFDRGEPSGLEREGILTLDEVEFFVKYCHFKGLEANLAGSLYSFHAQQIWKLVPEVDHLSTRGGSTAVVQDPSSSTDGSDTRHERATRRSLVQGLVPPEQGGCLNLPNGWRQAGGTTESVQRLRAMLPGLPVYWVNRYGEQDTAG